jgi:hypothetical protein
MIGLGITRIVLIVGNYAYKFPTIIYGMKNFLNGCYSNWAERKFNKDFKSANFEENMIDYVAPSIFCSWFGLIQIQKRCDVLTEELSNEEKIFFNPVSGGDNKKENFGFYMGKKVCLDYGQNV